MAPFVFGLDLANIRFSAFKSANMFDGRSYLRSQRFIIYQLAMIIIVCAESTATYAMSRYLDMQSSLQRAYPSSYLYNNDIVGAASLTIFAGVFTAIVYGTLFFFLLFWPNSVETPLWATVKKISAIFCTLVTTAALIWSTIVVTSHSAWITGAPASAATSVTPRAPLDYSHYAHNIAWIVLFWIGWPFVVASNVLVFIASAHHISHDRDSTSASERGLKQEEQRY
ncbi:hypothetical protein OE88DRAFT_1677976 [Heliocybe sulcata]|uniref:MARVEL domain-containing protein n=1 Tax=Heliocybe sulcata TaxID=5364 RepID=A0A5C3N7V9_9AGAM|nr:hypothetical protein OE88DRAFT_1677976 [Heliocybe sulcata]